MKKQKEQKEQTTNLTAKQKELYLKSPNRCPYCNSLAICADHIEADYNTAWSNVECEDCGKVWKDIYTLTAVVDVA